MEPRTKARLVLFGVGIVGFVGFVLVAQAVIENIHPDVGATRIVPEEEKTVYRVRSQSDLIDLDKQLFSLSANAIDMKEIVLVTGGSGFICSHFVDLLLREGYQVMVMDRTVDPTFEGSRQNWKMKKGKGHVPSFIHVYGDVTNKADLELIPNVPISYVFHCAGAPPPRDFATTNHTSAHPRGGSGEGEGVNAYDTVHYESTKYLLELLESRDFPVIKFIVLSTTDVYGPLAKSFLPFSRMKNRPNPPNDWARSKFKMEKYIQTTWRKRRNIKSHAIIRPTTVYGPRQQQGFVADYIQNALTDQPLVLPMHGMYTRDYLFVSDLAEAIYSVMLLPKGYIEFNIGSTTVTPLDELAQTIQSLTKSSSPIVHVRNSIPYITNQLVESNLATPVAPIPLRSGLEATISSLKSASSQPVSSQTFFSSS